MDTPNTQRHDLWPLTHKDMTSDPLHTKTWPLTFLAWYTGTSIRSGGVKLLSWSQLPLLVKWCGHVSTFHVWVKCQPSHIIGEQFYFKECYNLEHYIHFVLYLDNIINLRDIEVVTFSIILVLLKKADGFNKNLNIRQYTRLY